MWNKPNNFPPYSLKTPWGGEFRPVRTGFPKKNISSHPKVWLEDGGWRLFFFKPWDFWVDILCLKNRASKIWYIAKNSTANLPKKGQIHHEYQLENRKKIEWSPLILVEQRQKLNEGWSFCRLTPLCFSRFSCQSLSIHNKFSSWSSQDSTC